MTKIRKVMKTNKLMMSATAFLLLLAGVGCGNRTTKAESTAAAAEAAVGEALQIDDLLAGADSLAGKEVWIEGVCTHACKHGARKIFLMGSDDTQTIRVESGKLGKFDPQCVGSIVRVKGILREQRVDEDYLRSWEEQVRTRANSTERLRPAAIRRRRPAAKRLRPSRAVSPTSVVRSPNGMRPRGNPICRSIS